MSSSYDSGKSAAVSAKVRKSKCPKSPNGRHKWVHHFPESPSSWGECKHCDAAYFNK